MSSKILKITETIAREVGKYLLDNFGKIKIITKKEDRSLATNIDKSAENFITKNIIKYFPKHSILAEEDGLLKRGNEYLWIIDPLDGTHNFIRGVDIFGVSLGLVYRREFVLGVVYLPKEDEMYIAEKGSGAYKNGKKIHTSDKKVLEKCSLSFDSSIRLSPERMSRALKSLSKKVFNIRMFGSSARALTYLAEGVLDGVIEFYDKPWDFAGGACIIKEAGGIIGKLGGGKLTHKMEGYVASNKYIYRSLQKIIKPYAN